jgi:hypothetical protein
VIKTAIVKLAPIALFVFKRHYHTRKTLESLALNPEFLESQLYIFCDGPKTYRDFDDVATTRKLVKGWPHPNKIIVERQANMGLANSIILGVSELTEKFGTVIVVEDDLVVSSQFIGFLNDALIKYASSPRVMQISAFMFSVEEFSQEQKTVFFPFISSWGWATWARAWKFFDPNATDWQYLRRFPAVRKRFDLDGCYNYSDMLYLQMVGEIDSWAIRWNWSVYINNGLVVYPPVSLVKNIGFDGSGTHCRRNDTIHPTVRRTPFKIEFADDVKLSLIEFEYLKNALIIISGGTYRRWVKTFYAKLRIACLRIKAWINKF